MKPQPRPHNPPLPAHVLAHTLGDEPPGSTGSHWALLLRWPLPALAGWLSCALTWLALQALGCPPLAAWAIGVTLGVALALVMIERGASQMRVVMMATGFPVASLLHGVSRQGLAGMASLPAWLWLLPLGLLLLLYPLRAWRDAPLFPTEAGALDGLTELVVLPPGAHVLDAGCGLGNGLEALRRAWPLARLEGVEWSPAIAWLARLRCPGVEIRHADMWAESWTGLDVVYLFQRPETMPRALAKARAEMHDGAWLVSMEFEVCDALPYARLETPRGKPVWVYRMPAQGARPTLAASGGRVVDAL
ncbi:MAG: flagellar motor protein [Pseudomonadota bacterium]|jgi:hypothetical protein